MTRRAILCILLLLPALMAAQTQTYTANLTASSADCSVASSCLVIQLPSNISAIGLSMSGTFTATGQFEASADNKVATDVTKQWSAINGTPTNSTTPVTSTSTTGTWRFGISGLTYFRVRLSSRSSGTVATTANYSAGSASLGNGTGGSGLPSGCTGTSGTIDCGTALRVNGVNTIANPMTTVGDLVGEDATPQPVRIAGPTSPKGVPQVLVEIPSGGVAPVGAFSLLGLTGRTTTSATDTIAVTDRTAWVVYNRASPIAVTLPQAGSSGFGVNFAFGLKNIGAGAVTITPTTSTIDGASTLVVSQGQNCSIASFDNLNYTSRCASGQITAGSNITITPAISGFSISSSGGGVSRNETFCDGTSSSSQSTVFLRGFGSHTDNCTATSATGGFTATSTSTFQNLYFNAGTGGKSGDKLTLRVKNANGTRITNVTCTFGTGTTCNDTTHVWGLAVGDIAQLYLTTGASETLADVDTTFELTSVSTSNAAIGVTVTGPSSCSPCTNLSLSATSTFAASLSNDFGSQGSTFALGTLPCGAINSSTGVFTPGSGTACVGSETGTIIGTSVADTTKTGSVTATMAAGGGGGSFALLQGNLTGSGATITIPTTTSGSLIACALGVNGATAATNTVVDDAGDTWTHETGGHSLNNASLNETIDIWSLHTNAHAGTHSLTITYTNSGSGTKNVCIEVSGQAASPFDTCVAPASGTGASPSTTLTAATAGEFIFSGLVEDNGSITAGSGFTLTTGSPFSANWFEGFEYNLSGSSGSNTVAFTNANSAHYSFSACAFKHN